MTTFPHPDRWSFRHAYQAARTVRRAEFGRQAIATVRPRGVVGFARRRAPLAIMLYLASWEGRLCAAGADGFAVLEPPVRSGGRSLSTADRAPWLLRLLDRRWDTVVFAAPLVALLMGAAVTAPYRPVFWWVVSATVAYLVGLAAARAAVSLRWLSRFTELAQLGALGPDARVAAARPDDHWSLSLCHQPQPGRTDELLRAVAARLTQLVARQPGGPAEAMETLVCLSGGITTSQVRALVPTSPMAVAPDPASGEVLVLMAPAYPIPAGVSGPDRRGSRGAAAVFFVWYLCGLAAVTLANARYLAEQAGVGYGDAVAWLASRLIFSDTAFTTGTVFSTGSAFTAGPAGLGEFSWQATALGWLTSLGGLTTVAVGVVAGQQYLAAHRELREDSDAAMTDVITRSRVLILVVTATERDAVIDAVVARTGRTPVASFNGDRTVFALGKVGGADLLLAQAGEGGVSVTSPEAINGAGSPEAINGAGSPEAINGAGSPEAINAAGSTEAINAARSTESIHAARSPDAGAVARAAIRLARPDYVVMVGTCYGLRPDDDEQRIGDILVSQRVQSVDRPRVADRFGATRVLSRGVDLGPSPILLERCRSAQRSWSRHRARIHFGLILSSSTMSGAQRPIGDLRRHHPDALGGEADSVYEAAARHRVHWVMVKAISDWGAGPSEEFEDIAARNAADFATHMVAIGSLPRP